MSAAATIAIAAGAVAGAVCAIAAPTTSPMAQTQPAVTTAPAPHVRVTPAARAAASATPTPTRRTSVAPAPKAAAPVHRTSVAPAHHITVAPAPKAAAPVHRVTAVRTASRRDVTCAGVWAEALRILPVRGPLNLRCGPTPTGAPGFSEANWSAPGHVTSANSWVDLAAYPGDEHRDVQLAVHELMHQRVWHATAAQQQQVFRLLGTTAQGYGQSRLPYLNQPAEALAASTARVLAGAPQSGYRAIPTSTVRAIVAATA